MTLCLCCINGVRVQNGEVRVVQDKHSRALASTIRIDPIAFAVLSYFNQSSMRISVG